MSKQEVDIEPGHAVELTSLRTRRVTQCVVGRTLAVGGTAKVFDGHLADGQRVVLKAQRFRGRPDPAFELEIELFRKLFHRNIVHCVGEGRIGPYRLIGFRRAYTNPQVLLSREGLSPQKHRDKSARYTKLPLDTALDLSYELYNGLAYLEKLGFVHHDVKPGNVLVDVAPRDRRLGPEEVVRAVALRRYRAVLIDFGATRSRTYLRAWNRGEAPSGLTPQITPVFAPPEALVESRQSDGKLRVVFHPSLDGYAAALMTYSLLTGHSPYSHLQADIDLNDLETVIGLKSAERRGEILPISGDVLRRVIYEDTKFLSGSRQDFDQSIEAFLLQRLAPDPDDRGTALDMKLEFERLARISQNRGASSYNTTRRGSKIYLPFAQGLVEVGGRHEHPLLRAAETLREEHAAAAAPEPEAPAPAEPAQEPPTSAAASPPSSSAEDWLEGASSGTPSSRAVPDTDRASPRAASTGWRTPPRPSRSTRSRLRAGPRLPAPRPVACVARARRAGPTPPSARRAGLTARCLRRRSASAGRARAPADRTPRSARRAGPTARCLRRRSASAGRARARAGRTPRSASARARADRARPRRGPSARARAGRTPRCVAPRAGVAPADAWASAAARNPVSGASPTPPRGLPAASPIPTAAVPRAAARARAWGAWSRGSSGTRWSSTAPSPWWSGAPRAPRSRSRAT
ncbi:MAG: protein kinase [Planctomycetota bacterium]